MDGKVIDFASASMPRANWTEDDLGPEPEFEDGNLEELGVWTVWCAKCAAIRFSGLHDVIEIYAFHMAVEEIRNMLGNEATDAFINAAFPMNPEALEAGLRPVTKVWEEARAKTKKLLQEQAEIQTFGALLARVRACRLTDEELLACLACAGQDGEPLTYDEIAFRCEGYRSLPTA